MTSFVQQGPIAYHPNDPAVLADPYPYYERLREEAPLHYVDDPGFWVLSRFEDVFAAARDTETFSSARGLSYQGGDIEALGLAPTIVMMDPPDHTAFRRLVSRGFTPRRVSEIEAPVRHFVRERLDRLRAGGGGDFVEVLAGPLPTFVVASYLGVPEGDRDQFDGWTDAIVASNATGRLLQDAADAVTDLYGYFTELIERRRREPADDLVTDLLAADIDGVGLTVEEILGFCFVMVAGGNDTTTGLLGGAAVLLTEYPDERRRLIDDPSLIPNAVDELLRLTSPVQGLSRATTRDVELYDRTLEAGSRVHLLYAAANRDPRQFGPTAARLDVGRTIERLMTFSAGPHFCLGAAVARLQGRVVLEELLGQMPDFEVDVDAGVYAPGPFVRRLASLPFLPSGSRR